MSLKKQNLQNSLTYKAVTAIQKYMDTWCLDAIIGFFLPGIGDILTTIFVIPYIHISFFQIRSVPLTLAVIYNTMMDCLIGMVPFGIGDLMDVFNKSYKKSYRLIVGFVEDDREIIKEVNKKAVYMAVMIVVLFVLIICMFWLVVHLIKYVATLFS